MMYASAGQMKCFKCGDVSHKCVIRLYRQPKANTAAPAARSTGIGSSDAPLTAVLAPVSAREASDKTPDGGPGSQLPAVGNRGVVCSDCKGRGVH